MTGPPSNASPPPPPPTASSHVAAPAAPRLGVPPPTYPLGTPLVVGPEDGVDRRAKWRLLATPEIATVVVTFLVVTVLATESLLGSLVVAVLAGIVGMTWIANGDFPILAILLLGFGWISAIALGRFGITAADANLLMILPMLVVIAVETAATYNANRRRRGHVDPRIAIGHVASIGAVLVLSVVLAVLLRTLSQRRGEVGWPWFAIVVVTLIAGAGYALRDLHARAHPTDRRRYRPGHRSPAPPR